MVYFKSFVALCALLLLLASPAMASPLNDAKQAGFLGEKGDGYVGVVTSSAPGHIKQLADEINLKRRAKYRSIADKNGTSLRNVESLVGDKLLGRAGPGEYVMQGGGWVRK
uniref:DUF1318 domain-containing protein n=1 Tax=Magnetococcus massalia (strain MO-1) TaxID=451514 RepID=A0A1S7LH00_MAGMO|nr:Conserved exported protein of unknown function [Candidatus Magnetococcus massalia]